MIVLPDDTAWAAVAADEITDRLESISGETLPVRTKLPADRDAVVIGRWQDRSI